jgi:hypothetical protein
MPDEKPEHTGVLVIRAWKSPEHPCLVARITGRADLSRDEETTTVVAGSEAAAAYASGWLTAFERAVEPDPQR